jgi:hypothetical protein
VRTEMKSRRPISSCVNCRPSRASTSRSRGETGPGSIPPV